MYKVLLVDDERLIVKGLSSVVPWEEMKCQVVGAAYDGRQGLALIRQLQPDIVLTDIRMPNMDGLTMLAALRSEYPRMQTSVLTAYRDFDYARQALNVGVCRYLLKPSQMDELEEAIRTMVARLDALPPDARARRGYGGREFHCAGGACLYAGALRFPASFSQRSGGSRICEPMAPFQASEPGNRPELFRSAGQHAHR
jgi:CheY-like chemotaxis protein